MKTSKTGADHAALLEAFAEACTDVARNLSSNKNLDWETGKPGFVHFHCPLPGLHGAHGWTGAPRANAWIKAGNVHAWCSKCVGDKKNYSDHASYEAACATYTEEAKKAIRWEQDGVVHGGFKSTIIRSHMYIDRNFLHVIGRDKVRYEDGRRERTNAKNPWRWRVAEIINGQPGAFSPLHSVEPWLREFYPELQTAYEALCWYGIEQLIDPAAPPGTVTADTIQLRQCTLVWTEGEHDADTVNAVMRAVGRHDVFATCLSHPKPTRLASHHMRVLAGRDIVVIGDADDAGKEQAENSANLAWIGHAKSIKVVREQLGLVGTPDAKDLTDWVVQRVGMPPGGVDLAEWLAKSPATKAVADELFNLFAATAPLVEPFGRLTEWREHWIENKGGGVKADSPHNAERVWTMHPALKGHVRTNLHSGEVEIIDPPWSPGTITTGSRDAAVSCAMWLERTERVSLSIKVLEEAVRQGEVAKVVNTMPQPGAWDGAPAIGRMLVDVPLDAPPEQMIKLWAVFFADLAAKLRGERAAQRCVLGIATERNVDIARAIMGDRGAVHGGGVSESHLLDYARRGVVLVQLDMKAIADQRRSMTGMSYVLASDVWNRSLGRALPTPLFFAVGPGPADKRTWERVDERCLILKLRGAPLLDALRVDGQAALSEAAARQDEIYAARLPDPTTLVTVDAHERRKASKRMLWLIYEYATKELPRDRVLDPTMVKSASLRKEPLRHVVRDQMLDVMQVLLFNEWRAPSAQAAAFNAACRAMKWVAKISLTSAIAGELGLTFDFTDCHHVNVPGTYMNKDRLKAIKAFLEMDDDLPPKGGGFDDGDDDGPENAEFNNNNDLAESPASPSSPPPTNALNENDSPVPLETLVCGSQLSQQIYSLSRVRPRDTSLRRGWLSGPEALAVVRAILATPGVAAVDFETYPTNPKWHGEQAAARAADGSKGKDRYEARLKAQMNGRAHVRQACTLQLHHEDGAEVFVRLTSPANELPAMFEGRVASLVAHNAQFETEVLLKHGIAADIDCTQLAAKALHLTAVRDDQPQPIGLFDLKTLVREDLKRTRNKEIRDRDWREKESLDDEAVEYGLQDARDALDLWRIYRGKMEEAGLLDGYRVMQRAILPTAATNLKGLTLDAVAHDQLIAKMTQDAQLLEAELNRICLNQVENHGSTVQISNWVMEAVLGHPVTPPIEPKLVGLVDYLAAQGGLKPCGELRDVPKKLIRKRGTPGLGLDEAANLASAAGYIGRMRDYGQLDDDVEDADPDELVEAIRRDLTGDRVLTLGDDQTWRNYQVELANFNQGKVDDGRSFDTRLMAKIGHTWRTTKTGHLSITKGGKLRKAEQLADAYPHLSNYLVAHAQWTRHDKLISSFGPTLKRWRDDDDRVRSQVRVWSAWTGRQSAADPNIQNQPRESEFRALWIAPPGRKLVIADYSQIELRLLAIESGDEVMRQIYRDGRDIHAEVASIAFGVPLDQVDKELRRQAKAIGFGIAYGSSAAGLAEHGGFDLDAARAILERVLEACPGLKTYRERMPKEAIETGWIKIRPGRRVEYDQKLSSPTQAINAPIQGGAASVQMLALRMIHDALAGEPGLAAFVCASVHDEFILEAPDDERVGVVQEMLVQAMTDALCEIYPEAKEMGLANLTAAAVCSSWAEKP